MRTYTVALIVATAACVSSPAAPALVTDLYDADSLHVAGDTLYFRARGYVWSMPPATGSATQLYASGCGGIQADASSIYFFGPKHDEPLLEHHAGHVRSAAAERGAGDPLGVPR